MHVAGRWQRDNGHPGFTCATIREAETMAAAGLRGDLLVANEGGRAVVDVGLKALGMDHGPPTIPGAQVWFCSDEHTTFAPGDLDLRVGDRIRLAPAHVDPTVALHEAMYLVEGDSVAERWPVDMRGW